MAGSTSDRGSVSLRFRWTPLQVPQVVQLLQFGARVQCQRLEHQLQDLEKPGCIPQAACVTLDRTLCSSAPPVPVCKEGLQLRGYYNDFCFREAGKTGSEQAVVYKHLKYMWFPVNPQCYPGYLTTDVGTGFAPTALSCTAHLLHLFSSQTFGGVPY